MAGPMTLRTTGRRPITGRQLVLALTAIVLATVVLPPTGAWWLNARRIDETQERATLAAGHLRGTVDRSGVRSEVVCGPGTLPNAPASSASLAIHDSWMLAAVKSPEVFGEGMPTDAWGRCFLLNLGAARDGGQLWVLSAGPNGVIETARDGTALAGDDIGAVVK